MNEKKALPEQRHETKNDAPTVADEDHEVKQRSRGEVFTALIKDRRVGHGEFRFWHLLRSYMNASTGDAFPGVRQIQQDLGCSNDSIKPWREALIESGWLSARTAKSSANNNGFRWIYTLLDGNRQPLPKAGKATAPKSRNSQKQEHTAPGSRSGALLKVGAKLKQSETAKYNKLNTPLRSDGNALRAQPSGSGVTGRF